MLRAPPYNSQARLPLQDRPRSHYDLPSSELNGTGSYQPLRYSLSVKDNYQPGHLHSHYQGYRVLPPGPVPSKNQGAQVPQGNGKSTTTPALSPSLDAVLHPILRTLQEHYHDENQRIGRPVPRGESIDELRNAFDLAERSCPGLTGDFLSGVIMRLTSSSSRSIGHVELSHGLAKLQL